ncbi:choice-of-anchor X domain-containing protein [Streptomyces sp. NPDC102395]|uniref:choice-of-anchor X domain-containing protein n=1 Tax=Streptomyces sp. NPDC102395 TaxID=3366168 RepID=UPI00381C5E62
MCGLLLLPGASPSRAAPAPAPDPAPVDFVVLVDESASLSPQDVTAERAAASMLTLGEFSPRSRAAVVGFGSQSEQGRRPVDVVCPLTRADTAGRERLSTCVSGIRPRTAAEGNGTDFPAAITQGLSMLRTTGDAAAPAAPKILFLLTDGRLDVRDSPNYGPDADRRNDNAAKALTTAVAQARADKVQIWPLGFGDGIDRSQLDALAAGGYQTRCGALPSARPRARVTPDSDAVSKALLQAFAGARCARTSPDQAQGTVTTTADFSVTIPPVASDGSIVVVKERPEAVAVTYYDPEGRKVPLRGSAHGSAFELVGQDGPVESLRIRDPHPGTWRVHVEVLGGSAGQQVSATALWQGVLRSFIVLDPPSPAPGQKAAVHVLLQTARDARLIDPGQLAGIGVSVSLTGKGFAPVEARLTDDGRSPDHAAGDGEFSGAVTVPAAADGELEFVGHMVGEGITGDERPYRTTPPDPLSPLAGSVQFEDRRVEPGGTARGLVKVHNSGSAARTVRVVLGDAGDRVSFTISPQQVRVGAGQQISVPLTLRFAEDAPTGPVPGTVSLRDERGRPVAQSFLILQVVPRPGFLERNAPAVGVGSAVLALLALVLVLRWQGQRRSRDVSTLQLILHQHGVERSRLRAPAGGGAEFGFQVRSAGGAPRLFLDDSPGRYRVRRFRDGLAVRTPDGERLTVPRGRTAALRDGLALGFADTRSTAPAPRRGAGRRSAATTAQATAAPATPDGRGRRRRSGATGASASSPMPAKQPYDDAF